MIEITHTWAEGTLVTGTAKGDGSAAVLKPLGFRWSRNIGAGGAWYLPRSRDRDANGGLTQEAWRGLTAAGVLEVRVSIDNTSRSAAEREADRAERLAGRADHLEERAGRLDAAADTLSEEAHRMADAIPFGQPILVGHHSEGRDRRYRARMAGKMDRAVETDREATETARRAAASRAAQDHHLSMGATRRRITNIEAELRAIDRRLAEPPRPGDGRWRDGQVANRERMQEDLDYWRAHVAALEDQGVKVWGPGDFRVGDRVNNNSTVLRVNRKTLTVQFDTFAGTSLRYSLAYDKVRSRQPAGGHNEQPEQEGT